MFTINLKRSVAALAVTAGLLAAAAPASHAMSWGVNQTGTVKAPVSSELGIWAPGDGSDFVKVSIWAPGDGSDF